MHKKKIAAPKGPRFGLLDGKFVVPDPLAELGFRPDGVRIFSMLMRPKETLREIAPELVPLVFREHEAFAGAPQQLPALHALSAGVVPAADAQHDELVETRREDEVSKPACAVDRAHKGDECKNEYGRHSLHGRT